MAELKRKVTLKKKVAAPRHKKTIICFLFAILIVVAIVVFLFLRNGSSASVSGIPEDSTNVEIISGVETAESSTEHQDSTKQDESVVMEIVDEKIQGESTQAQVVSSSKHNSTVNVEQMAWSVIRGNYDNNPIRRQKLGEDYQVVQDKVNEFYRKGLVR